MFVLKSPANLLFWVCNKRFRTSVHVHVQQQDSFFFDFLPVFLKISVATKYIIDFRSLRSHFTSCIKKLFQSFSQWRKDNSYSYAGVQWMHCWSVIIVSSLKNYIKKLPEESAFAGSAHLTFFYSFSWWCVPKLHCAPSPFWLLLVDIRPQDTLPFALVCLQCAAEWPPRHSCVRTSCYASASPFPFEWGGI